MKQVPTSRESPKNADQVSDGFECLIEGCDKPAQWKGLCSSCYGCARELINEDKTSWNDLAELGLCVLVEKPFYKAFRAATKKDATHEKESS